MAAVAVYNIPHARSVCLVMDGLFLTAQRHPRYSEVQYVLDIAEKSGKIFFNATAVPFTSLLSPEAAATVSLEAAVPIKFCTASRTTYFSLLSNIYESELSHM